MLSDGPSVDYQSLEASWLLAPCQRMATVHQHQLLQASRCGTSATVVTSQLQAIEAEGPGGAGMSGANVSRALRGVSGSAPNLSK